MRREYPECPIMGVGGIIFEGDTVLLARRNQDPGRGTWTLPGGAVELGETLLDALERELLEELSIRVEIKGLVRLLDRIIHDAEGRVRFHYIIADYWGCMVSGEVRPGSDISDALFVPLTQLSQMGITREVEETIRMAVRLREVTATGESQSESSLQLAEKSSDE